jgi:hypothetical protein
MKRFWEELPRGDNVRAQWAKLYVTMNAKGSIVMNRAAHERAGSPEAYRVLFDPANKTIGLCAAEPGTPNAYPAHRSGKHGGRRVNAYRLITERGLHIKETLEFPDAEIDEDGILLLHLRTAVVSNRALNHPTRRRGAAPTEL